MKDWMRIKIPRKTFVVCLLLFLATPLELSAVLPPGSYDKIAKASQIKATARVTKIEILAETDHRTHKRVSFDLITAFEENIPAVFSGTCYSVDPIRQKPMVGGTIYYYPVVGQKVLVTIRSDFGTITSFTPLNQELTAEIQKNRLQNISFNLGRASINHGN